jgi:hypothetical protein
MTMNLVSISVAGSAIIMRVWFVTAIIGSIACVQSPVSAQVPVAIVEVVESQSAGVEFLDYVSAGTAIRLAPSDRLVLEYLRSCWQETITGGTVIVAAEQSEVRDGKIERAKVQCDGPGIQLTLQRARKSGGLMFRRPLKEGRALPRPNLTIYGLSPVVELNGGGRLVIEPLDSTSKKIELQLGPRELLRKAFYDLAKVPIMLAPGLYQASNWDRQIVFKVDPTAKSGQSPIISRLLPLVPAN